MIAEKCWGMPPPQGKEKKANANAKAKAKATTKPTASGLNKWEKQNTYVDMHIQ